MTGLDRIRFAAERTGFAETGTHVGYRDTVTLKHEDGRVATLYRTVRGGITYAHRNWGSDRVVRTGSGKAERVLRWLNEPKESAETVAKPVVRSALPNTPDRKLRRLLGELEYNARRIRESSEPFQRDWTDGPYGVDELEEMAAKLGALSQEAEAASKEAMYLMLERHPYGGAELVQLLRAKADG